MKYALWLLALTGCGCMSLPSHEAMRATTLRLEFTQSICSGTAIGPDLILTAEHCVATPLQKVDGAPVLAHVAGRSKARDMALIRVHGKRFKRWARLGPPPKQGDHVRWFGNPNGWPDMYREGVVSRVDDGAVILDASICHGDSGAGLLDDAGRVVGVVSAMSNENGCTFMKAGVL